MLERFQGEGGKRLRTETLQSQKLVGGNRELAEALTDRVEVRQLAPGDILIRQDATDNDVYFILSGEMQVVVKGRVVATRGPGDHVGEMAAVEPTQPRSASVLAVKDTVVAKLTEADLAEFGAKFPEIYRCIAKELARRLVQRNDLVNETRDKIHVFLITSAEALEIGRVIQDALQYDGFIVSLWTDGCFRAANYVLKNLEDEVDRSDFAIAIAHADDMTESRGREWPAPRDNVIFELGLFMGRLGRERAILMEPRDIDVKLPSDLAGVTTVTYTFEPGRDAAALMGPACNALRKHIKALGPNN